MSADMIGSLDWIVTQECVNHVNCILLNFSDYFLHFTHCSHHVMVHIIDSRLGCLSATSHVLVICFRICGLVYLMVIAHLDP